MAALTKDDLRDYVLSAERNVADGYVLLDMKHNLTTVSIFGAYDAILFIILKPNVDNMIYGIRCSLIHKIGMLIFISFY